MSSKPIFVKVYFKEEDFNEVCDYATRVGIRPKGMKIMVQKPHGAPTDLITNGKGISKFLKFCFKQYKQGEANVLIEQARIRAEESALQQRKKAVGL